MKLSPLLAILALFIALCAALPGCGGDSQDEGASPADAVRGYYEALYNNDTRNEEDIQALTQHIMDEYFSFATENERRTMEVGLPLVINATSRNGGASVEFLDVSYETLDNDGEAARVRMTGTVRSTLPDGEVQERELDTTYLLALVGGKWKITRLEE